jgi:hypothetical protein
MQVIGSARPLCLFRLFLRRQFCARANMAAGGFWRPGTAAPSAEDRDTGDSGEVAIYNPNAWRSLQQQRQILPIYKNSTLITLSRY